MLKLSMTLKYTYNVCMILNNKIMAQYRWILRGSPPLNRHGHRKELFNFDFSKNFFKICLEQFDGKVDVRMFSKAGC